MIKPCSKCRICQKDFLTDISYSSYICHECAKGARRVIVIDDSGIWIELAEKVEFFETVRDCVQQFAQQMEQTLKDNDYKGGWDHMSPLELLNRLKEETSELADALEGGEESASIKEAIDVANFAMMIFNIIKE